MKLGLKASKDQTDLAYKKLGLKAPAGGQSKLFN